MSRSTRVGTERAASMRELIRKDQDRKRLRAMILQGATSGPAGPVDTDYFESLRARVRTARE